MSYLAFITVVAFISLSSLFLTSFLLKKKIWVVDRGFIGTLVIFYLLWLVGDALALKLGFYIYNTDKMLNINVAGIPLEDHLAGVLIVLWIRGLFDLFERRYG